MTTRDSWDVLVVGGGHAGVEAALASSRRGVRTALLTHDVAALGVMPCNPAIGGLGKGHLVKEIDALGGEMGRAIDATGIQFRLLNRRKGPAVRSPRAQADKHAYQRYMTSVAAAQPGLDLIAGEAADLLIEDPGSIESRIRGVRTADGRELLAGKVILCAGTFLRGLMHIGDDRRDGGRAGAASSRDLSGSLAACGVQLARLKTGTPPRLLRSSIDFERTTVQAGDPDPSPFSFRTKDFDPHQVSCHITHTNADTHKIILANLYRSPLYGGIIDGAGPRYCPSIEDKVVRFADKSSHHIFLEPEGLDNQEIYVNGLSTSLPADVQEAFVRSVPGLEDAVLLRHGYAVEYDSIPSWQVGPTLEMKSIRGLYLAGQILGTSGYEEAAAQGLVAGVNASLSLQDEDPFILSRDEAYIGVLIDDLVTKEISEPYRMFTSRAEHRLSLRCDNAPGRLLRHAQRIGLLPDEDLDLLRRRVQAASTSRSFMGAAKIESAKDGEVGLAGAILRGHPADADIWRAFLAQSTVDSVGAGSVAWTDSLESILELGEDLHLPRRLCREAVEQAAVDIRYEGYIAKQERLLKRQAHLDDLEIPAEFPYSDYGSISFEAREKLSRMRPLTIGQAGRIDGVRTSDLAVLSILVQKHIAVSARSEGDFKEDS